MALFLPEVLYAGRTYDGTVVVVARRPVPVEFVNLRIEGWSTRGGKGSGRERREQHELAAMAPLCAARELPAGESRFAFSFTLPEGLPASFRGDNCETSYSARVHISIPWWPDRQVAFDLCVAAAHDELLPATSGPLLVRSHGEDVAGDELHMEVGFASTTVRSGHNLEGKAAFQNLGCGRAPHLLRFEFVQCTSLLHESGSHALSRRAAAIAEISLADLREGVAVPFVVQVPCLAPARRTSLYCVEWLLRCVAVRRRTFDVVTEILISISSAPDNAPERRLPVPAVGAERRVAVFKTVARESGLTLDDHGVLWGEQAGVRFGLRAARTDGGRPVIAIDLEYPRLGLGWVWMPHAGKARGKPFNGWVQARDEAQSVSPLRLLEAQLGHAQLRFLDDQRFEFCWPGGATTRSLLRLVDGARALCDLLHRIDVEVLPPPGSEDYAPCFAALARRLSGRFVRAAMAVDAETIDAQIGVELRFDADLAPVALRILYRPLSPLPIDRIVHRRGGNDAAWPTSFRIEAREIGRALVAAGHELEISAGEIAATVFPLPPPEQVQAITPTLVDQLAMLAMALSGRLGGYR